MESGHSLRQATEDDLLAIVQVENQIHSAPWSQNSFAEELTKPYSQFWVITDDETDEDVIGYLVAHHLMEDVQLLNVGVRPDHRGLGWGLLMMQKLLAWCSQKEAERLFLEVRASNLPAIGLYQKIGFKFSQIRKNFYSNGETAFQMEILFSERESIKAVDFSEK